MRRIFILSNTYYQLIVALQLKSTIYKNDEVVLFLSDHSNNSRSVVMNLEKLKYFTKVKYIETKNIYNKKNIYYKIAIFYENLSIENNRYKYYFNGIDNLYFDEMLFFNFDFITYNFYDILYEYNHNIKFSGYEEGLLSYNTQPFNFFPKSLRFVRKLIRKKNINDAYWRFYCFFPHLYNGIFKKFKIPLIQEQSDVIAILHDIFEIKDTDLIYPQKYIFFSSVYDFEGGKSIGEFELVRKIVDKVGKDNLIVKVHPRDTRTVYTDEGINVDKNSSKPWEIIQLLGNFSDKVFLTATSGSVLAGSFLTTHPASTFYLYRFCDISQNNSALTTVKNIELLLKEESMKQTFCKVKIAENIDDIYF